MNRRGFLKFLGGAAVAGVGAAVLGTEVVKALPTPVRHVAQLPMSDVRDDQYGLIHKYFNSSFKVYESVIVNAGDSVWMRPDGTVYTSQV